MRRTDPKDTTRSYFRSTERVLSLNGQWFYATREGETGPFSTRAEAQSEVDRFVRERKDLEQFQKLRERRAESPINTPRGLGASIAAGRTPLALVPKEETGLIVGNLALERRS